MTKKVRTKLCAGWRLGIYVGVAPASNECYVANIDGDVVKQDHLQGPVKMQDGTLRSYNKSKGFMDKQSSSDKLNLVLPELKRALHHMSMLTTKIAKPKMLRTIAEGKF